MSERKVWPYSPNKNRQLSPSKPLTYVQQDFQKLDEDCDDEDAADQAAREQEIRELKKFVDNDEDVYLHLSSKNLDK
jgi:hypothetical protein